MKHFLLATLASIASLGAYAVPMTLNGTVRDFNADGVNFEAPSYTSGTGWVDFTLVGASPTLTATGSANISNTGAGAFSNWYTNAANTAPYALTLVETSPGSGIYEYNNNNFFPVDGELLGNEGRSHNYHFTYSIASTFGYTAGAGQSFTFTGDDDVWVFFDKKLGVDIGGVHAGQTRTVDLDTLLSGNTTGNYSFDLFFAERHTAQSNLRIETSLVFAPPSNVPEPGSLALVGVAMAGLGLLRRRTRA